MTLTITLYDQATTPLPNASLRIKYRQPNGNLWESEPLKTNANGVVRFPLPDRLFEAIDFRRAQYFIEYQGQNFRAKARGLPRGNDKRLTVGAIGLQAALKEEEETSQKPPKSSQVVISGTLLMEEKPVAGRRFGLRWTRNNGERRDIALPKTDDSGQFVWEGSANDVAEATVFQAQLYDFESNVIFAIEKAEEPKGSGNRVRFTWHIRKTEDEVSELPDLKDGDQGLVFGTITAMGGQPQVRLVVAAYDVDFPKDELLGRVESDDDGFYAINYAAGTLEQRKKDALDIVVRVFARGEDGDSKPLVESPMRAGAPIKLKVDLVTGAKVWAGASLYERIMDTIAPLLKGASLRDITPASIALLSVRTRYSATELGRFFAAWALALLSGSAEKDKNAAAPYFGWLTAGLPAAPVALVMQPEKKLREATQKAIRENWIPKLDYGFAIEAVQVARVAIVAQYQPELIAYLAAGGLTEPQAKKVLGIFLDGLDIEGRDAAFLAQLGAAKGRRAQELIEIWQALGGNTALGTAILQKGKVGMPRDLVELNKPELATIANAADAIPPHIAGSNNAQRAKTYAQRLLQNIEDRYPYAFFAHQLAMSNFADSKRLGQKLKNALKTQPEQAGAAHPLAMDDWDQELMDLGSLYLSAIPARRALLVDQLLRNAFQKVPDITTIGRSRFRAAMQAKFTKVGERSDADFVFTRAQFIGALANAVKMQEITEQMPGDAVPKTLARQLFQGSMNGGCPHCKSMTGPAAYLLDLVRYTDRAKANGNKTGWDKVDARRSDLKNMHLTCANSDTEMPYIDLVLEVLEDQVAPWRESPRHTVESAETLAEQPFYVNDTAYNTLKRQRFPWAAQFNRSFEMANNALAQAGLSLPELSDATVNGGGHTWLNLWQADLVGHDFSAAKIMEMFGVANLNALKKNTTLAALAQHLVIEPTRLLAMLTSAFVNPKGQVWVSQKGVINWSAINLKAVGRLALLGQAHIQTVMAIEELSPWLAMVNPERPNWVAEFAASQRLSAHFKLGSGAVLALVEMDGEARLTELAALASISEASMAKVVKATQTDISLISGMEHALQAATSLGAGGKREVAPLLALVEPALEGGSFAPNTAIAALAAGRIALETTSFEPATPPHSEEVLLVAEAMAPTLAVSAETLQHLMPKHEIIMAMRNGTDSVEAVIRLWKHASAVEMLALEAPDIDALPRLAQKFGLPDIANLPTEADINIDHQPLFALIALADLNANTYRPHQSLFLRLSKVTAQLTSLRTAFALPDLDARAIAPLLGTNGLGLGAVADVFKAETLQRLALLMGACRHLKTDGAGLLAIINQHKGAEAWQLVKGLASSAGWVNAARQISDPLRERCRDALLARVISASRARAASVFTNAQDVYSHFLIDPEMMAVVDTSRIKQASASLQQFVQRVQLGLEPNVMFTQDDASQWVWRHSYRVWEANRKVLVFPENWVKPELRDNKTSLYLQFESDLLKNEVRAETAEDALLGYARGLHDMAGLQMVALFEDNETGTSYILGRTRETPHSYYFNARGPNGLWDGWEKISVEIEGDHVIPVVYARRVFLAWVNFETKVAVDDPSYTTKISALESDGKAIRDKIDSISRKITELENKQEENAEYLAEFSANGPADNYLTQIYRQLDTIYEQTLVTLRGPDGEQGALQEQREAERAIIEETNTLKTRYTYCDASISVSQRHRGGGWGPVKKSISTVRTILENDGILSWINDGDTTIFYHDVDNFFVKVSGQGKDLTFTLCRGYRKDEDEMVEQTLGWFYLDIVNNVLKAVEKTSLNTRYKTSIALNGATRRQQIALQPEADSFTIIDNGPVRLLDNIIASRANVVPAQYAMGTSVLFEQKQRSYLVEKAIVAPQAHPREDQQDVTRPSNGETATQNPLLDSTAADVPGVALSGNGQWRFTPLFHPYSEVIVTELYRLGLEGLYLPDAASGQSNARALNRQQAHDDNFDQLFAPTAQVAYPRPVEKFEFSRATPFGVYNWELFFHAPLAIAENLRQNRRFAEARKWYHFIFNPMDKEEASPAAVWRFGPFFETHKRILRGDSPAIMDEADNPDFAGEVETWEQNPFNPHAIARTRTTAYMRATFMGYVENLIEWGDDLFRQDSMESVNEAAQLYIFAAELIGQKPVELPEIAEDEPAKSVAEALSWIPSLNRIIAQIGKVEPHPDNTATGSAFFELFGDFCMPGNDTFLGLWTTLEDRLFKIHNSLNIDGALRKLALYQPPIDPALLVKAAASGLSIADAISGLSTRRPHYRFTFMLAKALELTADVKALGNALLSALEKRDAEHLSQLRASHSTAIAKQMRDVFSDRIKEAETAIDGVDAALAGAIAEEVHYDSLIMLGDLPQEREESDMLTEAHGLNMMASSYHAIASFVSAIPQLGMIGPAPQTDAGGLHLSNVYKAFGDVLAIGGAQASFKATMAGRTAGRVRRMQDWQRAKDNVAHSVKKMQREMAAADIRLAMAEKDLVQHDLQISNTVAEEQFLTDKFTNEALYSWMVGQLSGLYFQSYGLASDLARQAEACYREDLSDASASFIVPGAWSSLHKGLLAGEQLSLDLRRMEVAYLSANRREHELTKSFSLAQINPLGLMALRNSGHCQFSLSEFLFDLDFPGHINRRIKSVNLTIPALAGPQTTIACTLSLTESQMRRESVGGATELQAGRAGETMATSTGQNDTGMFRFDFTDPRYLKFEGGGAISNWDLSLPDLALAQFDYSSVTDVILQIHYTAEDGPQSHVDTVKSSLQDALSGRRQALFSLRYDFPEVWAQLKNDPNNLDIDLDMGNAQFPRFYSRRALALRNLTLFSISPDPDETLQFNVPIEGQASDTLALSMPEGLLPALTGVARDVLLVFEFDVGAV